MIPTENIARKADATTQIIAQLREDYGLTQPLLVRLSSFSPRSIASWSHGAKATRPAATKFVELQRLLKALAGTAVPKRDLVNWLQEPNDDFQGSTPLQVIERGESDRLWHMIYDLRS